MKIALFIDEGVTQLILTPETERENDVIQELEKGTLESTIRVGNFYECQAGFVRRMHYGLNYDREQPVKSLMLVMRHKEEPKC